MNQARKSRTGRKSAHAKAGQILAGFRAALCAARLSRTFGDTAQALLAKDLRAGRHLDWTPAQAARLGQCATTTITRALPCALRAGLIECLAPADHGRRKAALYRFTAAAGVFFVARQTAESPSPSSRGDLRNQPSSRDTSNTDAVPVPAEEPIWGTEEPEIQAKLRELGANPPGIATARASKACDGPTALRFLTVLPAHWRRHGAPQNKPGWAIAALKNPAFLASVLAQHGGAPKPLLGAKDIPGLREALDRVLKAEPAHESPGFFDWLDRRSETEARLAAAVEATLPAADREALQARIRQGIPADLPQDFADRAFRRQHRAALLARLASGPILVPEAPHAQPPRAGTAGRPAASGRPGVRPAHGGGRL